MEGAYEDFLHCGRVALRCQYASVGTDNVRLGRGDGLDRRAVVGTVAKLMDTIRLG
jgi:hypothetical protein